ncbi:hypothetical protein [Paenibacillus gorillae]|uniref:hypothetical protein n=1 Tax=Paenibacillus gorillae TaxID=1243662 RepID=UPI0005A7C5F4|nr:hypothetical protein [Paenibacillus gorillae]
MTTEKLADSVELEKELISKFQTQLGEVTSLKDELFRSIVDTEEWRTTLINRLDEMKSKSDSDSDSVVTLDKVKEMLNELPAHRPETKMDRVDAILLRNRIVEFLKDSEPTSIMNIRNYFEIQSGHTRNEVTQALAYLIGSGQLKHVIRNGDLYYKYNMPLTDVIS